MILPKELYLQTNEGTEVIMSESVDKPVIIVPPKLYVEIRDKMNIKELKE